MKGLIKLVEKATRDADCYTTIIGIIGGVEVEMEAVRNPGRLFNLIAQGCACLGDLSKSHFVFAFQDQRSCAGPPFNCGTICQSPSLVVRTIP